MPRGVNKVILIGHLGRDPETVGSGICKFSLATSEQWTKDGNKEERTEWHNITAFSKLGEICQTYLKKGAAVYIEGKLRTRKWEKNGVTRYSTEIIADQMQMLGGRRDADAGSGSEPSWAVPADTTPTDNDDIPF